VSLQRYELVDGRFVLGLRLSLQSYGVSSLVREGSVMGLSDWASRDGETFFAVSWSTPEFDRVVPGTALVRLDLVTRELSVTPDDRCRGLQTASNVDDTLYFFSDVINGFGHAVYPGDAGQQDCILRFVPGATSFDPLYAASNGRRVPAGHEQRNGLHRRQPPLHQPERARLLPHDARRVSAPAPTAGLSFPGFSLARIR
jgi:hypothetical protein